MLRLQLAQQTFDRAELGDAVAAIFVLEQAGKLHTADRMRLAAFEQHFARAERDRANIDGDLRQHRRFHWREIFPMRARGGQADPRHIGQVWSRPDLRPIKAADQHGKRRVFAGEFTENDESRQVFVGATFSRDRSGIAIGNRYYESVKNCQLIGRQTFAVFEVFDGLFGKKFVELGAEGQSLAR